MKNRRFRDLPLSHFSLLRGCLSRASRSIRTTDPHLIESKLFLKVERFSPFYQRPNFFPVGGKTAENWDASMKRFLWSVTKLFFESRNICLSLLTSGRNWPFNQKMWARSCVRTKKETSKNESERMKVNFSKSSPVGLECNGDKHLFLLCHQNLSICQLVVNSRFNHSESSFTIKFRSVKSCPGDALSLKSPFNSTQ